MSMHVWASKQRVTRAVDDIRCVYVGELIRLRTRGRYRTSGNVEVYWEL